MAIQGASGKAVSETEFINPYNYVNVPEDRSKLPEPFLDGAPAGHGLLLKDHYAGRLSVKIETKTPMLLPDQTNPREVDDGEGAVSFGISCGADGRLLINGSSVKGMLRNAYEIITGSRFGVVADHSKRLAARVPTSRDLHLNRVRPAIVRTNADGALVAKIVMRLADQRVEGARRKEPSPTVRVPREILCEAFAIDGELYGENALIPDMKPVRARIALYEHQRL